MRFSVAVAIILCGIGAHLRAQDPPPAASAATTPAVPPPPILSNNGKPIVLPFQCTRDDIQAAGFTCSEEAPCSVYLELNVATSVGSKYYLAGNIHSDAVTLYSVLLGSEDAGRNWQEVHPRIRGAGLDHLQFIDALTGWAAGQQLFPIPQDPFVLLTADGGKTWRQQAIFENPDTRFGSVQEFRFSSKTDGAIVIDRSQGGDSGPFARYESPDGGASWSLKEQSNKAIHLKSSGAPEVEWRVRVDGNTKSFVVERRQGERWTSSASFAVNLGVCRVPEQ
jgi:hypothetical protein